MGMQKNILLLKLELLIGGDIANENNKKIQVALIHDECVPVTSH